MKVICLSAANVEGARNNSASVRACEIIREQWHAIYPQDEVEIVPLLDYEMKPCRMCGQCQQSQRCARDEAFNRVFEKLICADGLFVVVPHYAPLPSKLMMLCEKMQEIAFLNWVVDPNYRFPMAGRPAGIIGHGGQETSEAVTAYYQKILVDPLGVALGGLAMKIISAGEGSSHGVAFGIRSIARRPGTPFVDIDHDWMDVGARVAPLVRSMAEAAAGMTGIIPAGAGTAA